MIRKIKDPLAPKRPLSSFLLFSKEERPRVVELLGTKHPEPVGIELSRRWKMLDQDARQKWDAMGKEEKAKYEEEKVKYRPSEEFLLAAAAHQEMRSKKMFTGSHMTNLEGKMATYFTYLLNNWLKVASARPKLTPKQIQDDVWLKWSSGPGSQVRGKKKKVKDPNAPKHPMSAYLIFLNKIRAEVAKDNPKMTNTEVMAEAGKRWKYLEEEAKAPFVNEAKKISEEYYEKKAKYMGYF